MVIADDGEKVVLTVVEAARILGIGRSAAYQGVKTGELPTIRIGRRLLVPVVALERLLAQAGQDGPAQAQAER